MYIPLEPSSYEVVLGATTAPVTLADAKTHLSLFDDTTFDDHLENLIVAASEYANQIIGEYFVLTEIKASYKQWQTRLALPHKFIDEITSVSYYNASDVLTEFLEADYIFDNSGRDKSIVFTGSSPSLSKNYENKVIVNYNAQVPDDVYSERYAHAVLLIVAEMFNHDKRDNSSKVNYKDIPLSAQRLLADLRRAL